MKNWCHVFAAGIRGELRGNYQIRCILVSDQFNRRTVGVGGLSRLEDFG